MKTTASSYPDSCKSVFRGDAAATTKENYTRLWTALINQMERSKKVLAKAK